MKIINAVKEFAVITVGTVIVAAAVFFFMLPSHVSVGSGAAGGALPVEKAASLACADRTDSRLRHLRLLRCACKIHRSDRPCETVLLCEIP